MDFSPALSTLLAHGDHASAPAVSGSHRLGVVLYGTATLLPLLSFLLLLLKGGLRNYLRRYDGTKGMGQTIFEALGGNNEGRGPAYIATVAIGSAFVLAFIGFVQFARHHSQADMENQWADRTTFLSIGSYPRPVTVDGKTEQASVTDPRGGITLEIGYKIDNLATIMFLMVTFIATLIHIFSIGYMSEELQETVEDHHVHTEHGHLHRRGRYGRFFMYLSLFCFSMLNLIIADNLFQIFISWELVGICSYLLIGFYYERQSASNAANKAFITNRVGDAGFIIGLLIVWTYIGTFNFEEIFARVRAPRFDHHNKPTMLGGQIVRCEVVEQDADGKTVVLTPNGSQVLLMGHLHASDLTWGKTDPKTKEFIPTQIEGVADRPVAIRDALDEGTPNILPYSLLVVAGLGIFLGCVGKSAQFPLQVWLPDAMEGPTPVSALIHAATMVAAGVYLVARAFPMFTPEVKLVIAYTGAITLFVAATIALVMTDIKKVLAYSTVSQLGYMMLALGVGGWAAGLFHLLTHAFFKALLFLGSGSVIYGCHHEQEMTKMGGLFKKMPITALTMLAGVLAIAGTPLFTGWYSKDAILASAAGFVTYYNQHLLLFILPLLTAGITTFYMFRMWFMTFTGEPRDAHVYEHAHETPLWMTVPLCILAVCAIGVAWGWPVWDAEESAMEHHLSHVIGQPNSPYQSVLADYGRGGAGDELWYGRELSREEHEGIRAATHHSHSHAGLLALAAAGLGFAFAYIVYLSKSLDPEDAAAQFPGVYRFLGNKWAFDDLYSVILVRPALVVAGWFRWFDSTVIDGIINGLARCTVWFSKRNGRFDNSIIDGIANLIAIVAYGLGSWFRRFQTGYLRSYVLFLVMAAIGLFALLKYLVGVASAGQ